MDTTLSKGAFDLSCGPDCLVPPPNNILYIPPPPAPIFIQSHLAILILNGTPCAIPEICEVLRPPHRYFGTSDYGEPSKKNIESWAVSNLDDTWLLVLVASSIGVLLLGALLAMFLLKCREMNMFASNDCGLTSRDHIQIKNHESRECAAVNSVTSTKMIHPSETVLYHGAATLHPDNRMVWAALTPRGTQHFISENYPRDLVDYVEVEDHYETIDQPHDAVDYHLPYSTYQKDYENYAEPTPLIESYQFEGAFNSHRSYSTGGGNTDMRCSSLGLGSATLRRGGFGLPPPRPQVSSPTRIENPNLPPLNLYPVHKRTTSFRDEVTTIPKYGC